METINKAAEAICTPPVDLWMQMQRKRRRGDFNELRTLYIYRRRMTDGVIFQFNAPSSVMCNSDAKGGLSEGGSAPQHITGDRGCFLTAPPYCEPPRGCTRPPLVRCICVMTTFLKRVPVRVIIPDPICDDRGKGPERTDAR